MKKTYAAPTATECGNAVRDTLGKIVGTNEFLSKRPSGGSNLTFGL